MEKSLVVIKPDAVLKGIASEIIDRYGVAGFKILECFYFRFDMYTAQQFYSEHKEKPHFEGTTSFMSSGKCVAVWLGGDVGVVQKLRKMHGDWRDPAPGTIRAIYPSAGGPCNIVHTSDSLQAAVVEYEIVKKLSLVHNRTIIT